MTKREKLAISQRHRRQILKAGAGLLAVAMTGARAQGLVARQTRIVVPFAPGGPADILGRTVAEKLSAKWGRPVIVENRGGAGSSIGTEAVARSAPDGSTILLAASAHVMNAPLIANLPYHPVRDFSPIIGFAYQPLILSVIPSLPARTLSEFIDLAKRQPSTVSVGSAGIGNASHLAAALLEITAGVKFLNVPYAGSSQVQTALMGGHLQASFLNTTLATPLIRSEKLRGLGVTSKQRWRELPEVPSISELGYPDYECTAWYGFFGPAGMPEPLLAQLYQDIRSVLDMEDVRKRIIATGVDYLDLGPAQFRALVEADYAKWSRVIKEAGIKPE